MFYIAPVLPSIHDQDRAGTLLKGSSQYVATELPATTLLHSIDQYHKTQSAI
jgi:hypothetical protein